MSWRAHDGEVYSVEFSYDENTVFSIGEDGKVTFYFHVNSSAWMSTDSKSILCVFVCLCVCVQFVQWNIHRCGVKQSEQVLPQDATGPFVLSGYSGYKQVYSVTMETTEFHHIK